MRHHLVAGLTAVILVAAVSHVHAQTTESTVRVTITLASDGAAIVDERYRVAPNTAGWEFRILTRPCVAISDVHMNTFGLHSTLARTNRGPWIVLRDTAGTANNRDSSGFSLSYRVTARTAAADVPLAYLTSPILRTSSGGFPPVTVVVDAAAEPGSVVTFPRFERHSGERWSAHYLAIPSFVRVNRAGNRSAPGCDDARTGASTGDDDGGLTWRFWLFVGIMAAWVPIYLAWAGRRRPDDA